MDFEGVSLDRRLLWKASPKRLEAKMNRPCQHGSSKSHSFSARSGILQCYQNRSTHTVNTGDLNHNGRNLLDFSVAEFCAVILQKAWGWRKTWSSHSKQGQRCIQAGLLKALSSRDVKTPEVWDPAAPLSPCSCAWLSSGWAQLNPKRRGIVKGQPRVRRIRYLLSGLGLPEVFQALEGETAAAAQLFADLSALQLSSLLAPCSLSCIEFSCIFSGFK